ncbi:cyclophilin-like fold protein [Methanobrevibacter sp.]|uniref:cyclophilin-like fold protein n=1 Tax=Methanobrevibacter sp. TaxID=66852 RepID=UPI00388DED61
MFFNKRLISIAIFLSFMTMLSVVFAEPASENIIKLKVNNSTFDVKLEINDATKELIEKLNDADISIGAKEYGGFEKVGDLGFSLPTSDESITTSPGDLVLYNGNQVSLFCESHSWSYTKLGKIENVNATELQNVLGSGDVELVLSLK